MRKHSDGQSCGDFVLSSSSVLENEENINNGAVLTVTIVDPRMLSERKIADVPQPESTSMLNEAPDCEVGDCASLEEGSPKCIPSSNLGLEVNDSPLYGMDIWDINSGISHPVEEDVLSKERHHKRMNFIFHDDSKIHQQKTSTNMSSSRYCPIMLLKDNYQNGSVVR